MSCCRRYGPHISIKNTIYQTLSSLDKDCKCCQIFLGNPQSYTIRKIQPEDAVLSREYLNKNNMKLYVHAQYIINLASDDVNIVSKSKKCLQDLFDNLSLIGAEYTGIILHPGAKGKLQNIIINMNDLDMKVPLYLENSAGEGTKFGKNLNELRLMIEGINSNKCSVCIDTCHSFASGLVDFREDRKIDTFFEEMSFMDKREWIFHVNDSLVDFEAKADRHAPIGYGHMFNYNIEGSLNRLKRFYELAKSSNTDLIFETPNPMTDYFEGNFLKLLKF